MGARILLPTRPQAEQAGLRPQESDRKVDPTFRTDPMLKQRAGSPRVPRTSGDQAAQAKRPRMPARGASKRDAVALRHHRRRLNRHAAVHCECRQASRILGCKSPNPAGTGLDEAFGMSFQVKRAAPPDRQREAPIRSSFSAHVRQQPARVAGEPHDDRRSQSTFRSPAAVLPRSVFSSNETFCPSVSVIMPASLTAVM